MLTKDYYVYIMANKKNGTIYTGVTNGLKKRIWQHRKKIFDGFTKKYDVDKLVYYELFNDIELAIKREKQLKKWKRNWKIALIEKDNPCWKDLYDNLVNF
ncbi:MAG: GIY-YIG nuclease family protein [bacterium]